MSKLYLLNDHNNDTNIASSSEQLYFRSFKMRCGIENVLRNFATQKTNTSN